MQLLTSHFCPSQAGGFPWLTAFVHRDPGRRSFCIPVASAHFTVGRMLWPYARLLPSRSTLDAVAILLVLPPLVLLCVAPGSGTAIPAMTRQYDSLMLIFLVLALIPWVRLGDPSRLAAEQRVYRFAAHSDHVCAALPNHRRTARLIAQVCRPASADLIHVRLAAKHS